MKTKIKNSILVLFLALSSSAFSQTTLTQSQLDDLATSSEFKAYLVNNITNQAAYLLGLNSFDATTSLYFVYSRFLRSNPSAPGNDPNLVGFTIIQMKVRSFDKQDNGTSGSTFDKVKAYLDASSRIDYLVSDYFGEKTKTY